MSYTWVESYVQPLLEDLDAALTKVRDFQRADVTEFITYWPNDAGSLRNLGAFAKAVGEL